MGSFDVTFVIPGDFRSGGIRVTVIMANLLQNRGYAVRIVHPQPRRSLRSFVRAFWRRLKVGGNRETGWMHLFKGITGTYTDLDELDFRPDEVVIAVGTYMIPDVRKMKSAVIKLRYNHGFPASPTPTQKEAWKGVMNTITVSGTLVARLEELSGKKVLGVVPNGIDTSEYFPEPDVVRDGIGAVFNPHSNKAPEDMVELLKQIRAKWPSVPQYVFSTENRPAGLEHTMFTRYPSVEKARRIYNQSKIWLLTSYTEGLPGVVLEAMACGCVVISTNNDGSLEIMRHEENGLIVERGDLKAFMREVERVIASDELAKKLSSAAVASARNFSWDRAADKMEQVLEALKAGTKEMHGGE